MNARRPGPWTSPGGEGRAAPSPPSSVLRPPSHAPISYESYVTLIGHLDDLIAGFEDDPDPATRERAVALLGGLDALHREGLTRLVALLREAGAGSAVERAAADPVVGILLGLYDLADLPVPEAPQPPPGFVPLDSLRRRPRRAPGAEGG